MRTIDRQKFQFFRFSENQVTDDHYGVDVWDTEKVFLVLTTGEIYTQYLNLGLGANEEVLNVTLRHLNGDNSSAGFHHAFRKFGDSIFLAVVFMENLTRSCETFYLEVKTNLRKLSSNLFRVSRFQNDLQYSTLITYYHTGNFYNGKYEISGMLPQQMRVPMYFSHKMDEVNAEKFSDTYQLENRYRSGKVKRLFFEVWKIFSNDDNLDAFSVAMDSDFIFFDGVNYNVKPFEREQDEDNKGFTMSRIDAQRNDRVQLDRSVFAQLIVIKSSDYTYIFNYEGANLDALNHFQVANTFVNFVDFFGVLFNCELFMNIKTVPAHGYLMLPAQNRIISAGDRISYCDKNNLTYMPKGANNELLTTGHFTDEFTYTITNSYGIEGFNIMKQTLKMIDDSEPVLVFDDPVMIQGDILSSSLLKFTWDSSALSGAEEIYFEFSEDGSVFTQIDSEDVANLSGNTRTVPIAGTIDPGDTVYFRIITENSVLGTKISNVVSSVMAAPQISLTNLNWNGNSAAYTLTVGQGGFSGKLKRSYTSSNAKVRVSNSSQFGNETVSADFFESVIVVNIPEGVYNETVSISAARSDAMNAGSFDMRFEILDSAGNSLSPDIIIDLYLSL